MTKKAILSPVAGTTCRYSDIKGYKPSDAVYDWTVGRQFMCSLTQGLVDISDVRRLCEMGVETLVFTCGGASEKLPLENTPYTFDKSGLYCTDEVVDSLKWVRR